MKEEITESVSVAAILKADLLGNGNKLSRSRRRLPGSRVEGDPAVSGEAVEDGRGERGDNR
jgi:hypothetical protein